MSQTLSGGGTVEAASGNAESQVLLLHGYGADGKDLAGLGDVLKSHLPNTRFVAPDAPERCSVNPMGYQWFPIPWMDGSSEVDMGVSIARSADVLSRWLDEMTSDGIGPERTIVVGFSQGTMMSLHVALRRATSFAGIIGFSGRLMSPERLPDEIASRPPVLLVHGDADEMVPFSHLEEARAGLAAANVPVETHVSPGAGHTIAPDGLGAALSFMNARLG